MPRPGAEKLRRFLRSESGATAIEYSLVAGLIAAVIVGAVTATGTKVGEIYDGIVASLPS